MNDKKGNGLPRWEEHKSDDEPFFFVGLPSVTITQTSYSVITGSNQQIPCFVSANPTASFIGWTFRSATSGTTITITSSTSGYSIVTSSTSQSTLTILAADNNDEGTYTCQATNQVGNGSDSAFLDVTGSKFSMFRV